MCAIVVECQNADMAKLADAPDLGSGSERSEGSSPFIRTTLNAFYINSFRLLSNVKLFVRVDRLLSVLPNYLSALTDCCPFDKYKVLL